MSGGDLEEELTLPATAKSSAARSEHLPVNGVLIGQIVGFKDNGATPLVIYAGQPGTAALAARTVIDLHGEHIGRNVVLMFESGAGDRPIIMGCVRTDIAWPLREHPGQVEVEADGERLVLTAKEQLVLRCGQASITLTKSGKVLIQGAHVLSRSSGVNRIKGGSVQIN
jgi:hypothetical protein